MHPSNPPDVHDPSEERAILVVTCLAHALTHIYIHYFTAIIGPMRESFGLEVDGFTAFATVSTVLFGLGALPAGWLGDRFGEKPLLVAFFLLSALGGTVVAGAVQPWHLAAGMALIGAGTSIYHPVGIAMIAGRLREPGRAMGLNGLFGSLGTAAGPFLATQLTSALRSWRWAYLVLGAPALALGLWLAVTPRVRSTTRRQPARPGASSSPRGRLPVVFLLLGTMTAVGVIFNLVVTALPSHLGSRCHLPGLEALEAGGLLSALLYAAGGAGQLGAGALVHARDGRGLYVAVLAAAVPATYLVGHLEGTTLLTAGSLMAVLLAGLQPLENVLLSRYSPPGRRGVVYGLKFILVFGVGGLGTAASGAIAAHRGLPHVFTAAALLLAAALIPATAAFALRRRKGPGAPVDR